MDSAIRATLTPLRSRSGWRPWTNVTVTSPSAWTSTAPHWRKPSASLQIQTKLCVFLFLWFRLSIFAINCCTYWIKKYSITWNKVIWSFFQSKDLQLDIIPASAPGSEVKLRDAAHELNEEKRKSARRKEYVSLCYSLTFDMKYATQIYSFICSRTLCLIPLRTYILIIFCVCVSV